MVYGITRVCRFTPTYLARCQCVLVGFLDLDDEEVVGLAPDPGVRESQGDELVIN